MEKRTVGLLELTVLAVVAAAGLWAGVPLNNLQGVGGVAVNPLAYPAWFVNPNVTLVAAYVDAGAEDSRSRAGLGDGVVLSAQYAF
jgi:hypothetical protein